MKLVAIGTDIIQISRMQRIYQRSSKVAEVILSPTELLIFQSRFKSLTDHPAQTFLASRFCAKEALYKTLQSYSYKSNWHDASITNHENGAPQLTVHGQLAVLQLQNQLKWQLSISHEKEYAVAFVICYQE